MNLCGLAPYQKNAKRKRIKSPAEREDEAFLAWTRTQRSCISGKISKDMATGIEKNEPAHVLRVKYGAGKGKKPKLSAVPLTADEHRDQHQKGEAYCLNRHHPTKRDWTSEEAKEFFEDQRDEHVRKWREIC